MDTNETQTPDRLLDIEDVMLQRKCKRTRIYADIKEGRFPPPLKDGTRSRWFQSDIDKYHAGLAAKREHAAQSAPEKSG